MINKISQHFNKGMNRDISDSKVSNEFAFENHNIRITENNGDTLLSITNEKGNEDVQLYDYHVPNRISLISKRIGSLYMLMFKADYDVTSDVYFKRTLNGQTEYLMMPRGTNILGIGPSREGLDMEYCSLSTEENINKDKNYIYYIGDESYDVSDETVSMVGTYCGHCYISDYIVIFTQESDINHIYRINKKSDKFICKELYSGALNITSDHPIECVGDYQTENIIKVYWTDGVNQLRVINIKDNNIDEEIQSDEDPFGFALEIKNGYSISAGIDFSLPGRFPSGIIQYFITGVNFNNVESSILCKSNLVSLRDEDHALSENDNYNNAVSLSINLVKPFFKKYILYSIEHTSVNTTPIAKRVAEIENFKSESDDYSEWVYNITDNGDYGETIDVTSLLYKGSELLTVQTIDSKDNTLFCGNVDVNSAKMSGYLISLAKDSNNYSISQSIKRRSFIDTPFNYDYSYNSDSDKPYLRYKNYYRIGIQFKDKYGKWTNALYLDDVQISNKIGYGGGDLYCPALSIDISNINFISQLKNEGFIAARPLIVLPNEVDRVVIAQGVLNENLINIGDRNSGASYVDSSWFFRPIVPSTNINDPYGDLSVNLNEFRPYFNLPFANNLNAEIQSQNVRDYDYAFQNENKTLSQYLIEPFIQDFYSPDIDDTVDKENVSINVVGYCNNSTYNVKWNFRGSVSTPIGVKPDVSRFQNYNNIKPWNNHTFTAEHTNTGTIFLDSFYADDIDSLSSNKIRLGFILNNSGKYGLTYPVYPWHRDSSLNNDVPREGRTSVLNTKILSKYDYFSTVFLANDVALSNCCFNKFDNSVDLLKIKINNNNEVIYRGNVNTIVSPLKYATPIYVGKYLDPIEINYKENLSQHIPVIGPDTMTSVVIRDTNYLTTPESLIKLNNYGVNDLYNEIFDDDGYDLGETDGRPNDEIQTTTTAVSSMDPVSIKYKTCNHGVVSLNKFVWDNNYYLGGSGTGSWFAGYVDTPTMVAYIPTLDIPGFNGLPLVNLERSVDTNSIFGGKSEAALMNNSWIIGGDEVSIEDLSPFTLQVVNGDTYFNRWEILKTYQYANGDKNSIIQVGSFLLESYRNLNGRYDRNQNLDNYTTVNETNFGLYNDVYNQKDNFFTYRYLPDEYLTTNHFPNQFVWSLEHTPGADIDNWTNLSYGGYYNVNGDNGEIRAIRRYGDTLLGFQDSGIFQIMYNSRTQISTTNGLPIELANSGKVDGVRYLTEKEGCVNKWSIKITPNGVYFIDDLNYSINVLQGSSLSRLSEELGFSQWCKDNIVPYKLWTINNGGFRTYYDRILNDVYFSYGNKSLVYSEKLGQFMSFMDYPSSYAMDNIDDTFISFNNAIWKNRAGNYNSFFGIPRDYYVKYRIAPDPYINKTFNNIEYIATGNQRISGYTDLIVEGVNQVGHSDLTLRPTLPSFNLQKKFNVWRANIPREDGAILNRIQSPWIYLTLKSDKDKRSTEDKIELHNLLVKYSV